MTPAERQQRRRARLRREQAAIVVDAKRLRARDKTRAAYMPMPPGITYWRTVIVQTAAGEQTVYTPTMRPPASCDADLTDQEVLDMLAQLGELARRRRLT
jgi:hypothetical protein